MNLYSISEIKTLLEENGFSFAKKFGQNFLINEGVPQKIAALSREAAGEKAACIEIGPGIGSLTKKLAAEYDKVVCFEIDSRLPPILERTLEGADNVKIILEDILRADIPAVIAENLADYEVSVCANLPYYITSEVIMKLLECGARFRSITVMIQKEAAERLVSAPGSAAYGSITAAVGYYASVKKLFGVAPSNFIPQPKVNSSVIRLTPYTDKPVKPQNEALFFDVMHGAFAQRRKTLINSLSSFFGSRYSKSELTEAIEKAGISPSVRGETLSVKEYAAISDNLK